jgi:allantoin racemase
MTETIRLAAEAAAAPGTSIVTTLERTREIARLLVDEYGVHRRCWSLRATELAVLDLERPGSSARQIITEECGRPGPLIAATSPRPPAR